EKYCQKLVRFICHLFKHFIINSPLSPPFSPKKIPLQSLSMKWLRYTLFLFLLFVHSLGRAVEFQLPLEEAFQILRPTQFNYGPPRIKDLTQRFSQDRRNKIQNYLDDKVFPVIKGPENLFYMTDRHHLLL